MGGLIEDAGRVRDLAAAMAAGTLTAEALVRRCLARIAAVDGQVQAWVHVLAEEALAAARALDAERAAGVVRGPLHGIPVAVKDVIDVAGLPTRANSPSRAEIAPATADATVVAHLRVAGAVILGKVHTTEYAYFNSLPPTRNPWDLTRTPGGSSAGSGAAIASGTVPLALGTQTAGSVNRPAAYTGVGAFKPSTLAIGGVGVVPLAPSFDTVGAFGGSAQDAALCAAGYAADHLGLRAPAPVTPRIVVLEDAMVAAKTRPGTAGAVAALVGAAGGGGAGGAAGGLPGAPPGDAGDASRGDGGGAGADPCAGAAAPGLRADRRGYRGGAGDDRGGVPRRAAGAGGVPAGVLGHLRAGGCAAGAGSARCGAGCGDHGRPLLRHSR